MAKIEVPPPPPAPSLQMANYTPTPTQDGTVPDAPQGKPLAPSTADLDAILNGTAPAAAAPQNAAPSTADLDAILNGTGAAPAAQPVAQTAKPQPAQITVKRGGKTPPGMAAKSTAPVPPPPTPVYNAGDFFNNIGKQVQGAAGNLWNAPGEIMRNPPGTKNDALGALQSGVLGGIVGLPQDALNAIAGGVAATQGQAPDRKNLVNVREKANQMAPGASQSPNMQAIGNFAGGLIGLPLGAAEKGAQTVAQGLMHGAGMGAGFGAVGSLANDAQSGKLPDLGKAVQSAGENAAIGGALGAAAGKLHGKAPEARPTEPIPKDAIKVNVTVDKRDQTGLKTGSYDKELVFKTKEAALNHAIDNPSHAEAIMNALKPKEESTPEQQPAATPDGKTPEVAPVKHGTETIQNVDGPGDAANNDHSGLTWPKALGAPKPRKGTLVPQFQDPLDMALYTLRNRAALSNADHKILSWVRDNTHMTDDEIIASGSRVNRAISEYAKTGRERNSNDVAIPPGARDYGITRKPVEVAAPESAEEKPAEEAPQSTTPPTTYRQALEAVKAATPEALDNAMNAAEDLRPKKGAESYVKDQKELLEQAYQHHKGLQQSKKMADSKPIRTANTSDKPTMAPGEINRPPDATELPPEHQGYQQQEELKRYPKASKPLYGTGESTQYGSLGSIFPKDLTDSQLDTIAEQEQATTDMKTSSSAQKKAARGRMEIIQDEKMRRAERTAKGLERDWTPDEPDQMNDDQLKEHDAHYQKRGGEMSQREATHFDQVDEEMRARGLRANIPEATPKPLESIRDPLNSLEKTPAGGPELASPDGPIATTKTASEADLSEAPPAVPKNEGAPKSAEIKGETESAPRYSMEKTAKGYAIYDNRPVNGGEKTLYSHSNENVRKVNQLVEDLNNKGSALRSDGKARYESLNDRRGDIAKDAVPLDQAANESSLMAQHRPIFESLVKLKKATDKTQANFQAAATEFSARFGVKADSGSPVSPYLKTIQDGIRNVAKDSTLHDSNFGSTFTAAERTKGVSPDMSKDAMPAAYAKVQKLLKAAKAAAKEFKTEKDANGETVVKALREHASVNEKGGGSVNEDGVNVRLSARGLAAEDLKTKGLTEREIFDRENINSEKLKLSNETTPADLDRAIQEKVSTASREEIDSLLKEPDADSFMAKFEKFIQKQVFGSGLSQSTIPGLPKPRPGRSYTTQEIKDGIRSIFEPKENDPASVRETGGQLAAKLSWAAATKRYGNDFLNDRGYGREAFDRMCIWRRHMDRITDYAKATRSTIQGDLEKARTMEVQGSWHVKPFEPGDEGIIRESQRLTREQIMDGESGTDKFDATQRLFLADRAELRHETAMRLGDEIEQYKADRGDKASPLWIEAMERMQKAYLGDSATMSGAEKLLQHMTQGMYDYVFKFNPAFQVLMLHDPLIAGSSRVGLTRMATATRLLADKAVGEFMGGLTLEDPIEQLRQELRADIHQTPAETTAGKLFQWASKPRKIGVGKFKINTAADLPIGRLNNRLMMTAGLLDFGDSHYTGGGERFMKDMAAGRINDEMQFDALNHALNITDETLGTGWMGLNKDGMTSSPMLRGFAQFSSQMMRVHRLALNYARAGQIGKLGTLYAVTAMMGGSAAINKEFKEVMKVAGLGGITRALEILLDGNNAYLRQQGGLPPVPGEGEPFSGVGNLPAKLTGRDMSEKLHMQIMSYGTNAVAEDAQRIIEGLEKGKWANTAWAASMFLMPQIAGIGGGTVQKAISTVGNLAAGKKDTYAHAHSFIGKGKPLGNAIEDPHYDAGKAILDFATPTIDSRVADIQRLRRREAEDSEAAKKSKPTAPPAQKSVTTLK